MAFTQFLGFKNMVGVQGHGYVWLGDPIYVDKLKN